MSSLRMFSRLRINFLIGSLAVLSLAANAQPQTFRFALAASEGNPPVPRLDAPLVYDPAGRQLFTFGGQGSATLNDLWVYSISSGRWQRMKPSGGPPAARFGHTVVFDSARRRLIVFGGQAAGFFSDVWAYDISRNIWDRLAPENAGPLPRYGHSAIHDPARDRMVISHGFTDDGRFDDTWAFELATNTWLNISPAANRPLRRCLHHAVYDGGNRQMLFYGGCASGFGPCPLGDLWSFDLETGQWRELRATPSPPPRQWYGMAFDTSRSRLTVFGGSGSGGAMDDAWEYDPAANAWTRLSPEGGAPLGRFRHEAAYVPDRELVYFFGGRTSAGLTNELWELAAGEPGAAPSISAGGIVNAFDFRGGSVAPGEIISIFGAGLGPLAGFAASFDPVTGQLPRTFAGVTVAWNGILAPFYFASSGQLNVQAPYEIAGQPEADVVVAYNGIPGPSERLPVVDAKPGLFPVLFNQDASMNSPDNPAAAGSVLVMFATGQGVTSPPSASGGFPVGVFPRPVAAVSVRFGGAEAEVLFDGQAPGTAGVIQINARLGEGTPGGREVPVTLRIGEALSQPGVTVAIGAEP